MKKNKVLLVLSIIMLFFTVSPRLVGADSGWDTSYDGGGGSSSSSSSSYSYSSSSSSSSSVSLDKEDIKFIIICLCILLGFTLFYSITRWIYCKYQLVNYENGKIKKTKKIEKRIEIIRNKEKGYRDLIKLCFLAIIYFVIFVLSFNLNEIIGFIVLVFGPYISILLSEYIVNKKEINNKNKKIEKNYIELDDNEIYEKYNLNKEKIKEELYNKFIEVQKAWMNFDYDKLKKLCTNELYNTYYEELEALKLKDEQNIMSSFKLISHKITNIINKDNTIIVSYFLSVKFNDYVINAKSKKILKGKKHKKVYNIYILQYTKNINENKSICPNCGGNIDPGTTECEHCKAVIVQDSNEFVLNKKRIVR